ncbi:MAG TPA: ABC transporter ATP-binding protein [Bacillota bacterium]|nr:ABC transporter ATP-binding protein [Fastidiosipila sp.]HPX92788.1 ABC transporter ATP-binding protein [Bacillota bacterium]HQB81665.1 ABC transporter ATP-binding protein [Bacillota bacterium]
MQNFLEMTGICKTYEAYGTQIKALDDASISVKKGTVHGLLGENGAGKSTLMKILGGVEKMDAGSVQFNGREARLRSASQAAELGIGMVHQHFSLIEDFTVEENVVLGIEPTRFPGVISMKEVRETLSRMAQECGFKLDLKAKVGSLSMGQRQKVEILRLLYSNSELLIFDEPTSVLIEQEVESLLRTIALLKAKGKTIIYISHKVEEILKITDEVTVLRSGKTVARVATETINAEKMVQMMVGKHIPLEVEKEQQAAGDVLLEVKNLSIDNGLIQTVKNVSFELRAGEIVAVAGISGNGQQEMIEAILGFREPASGQIYIGEEEVTGLTPRQRRQRGVCYIPEDRIQVGSCATATLAENMIVDRYFEAPLAKRGWINLKTMHALARELVAKYKIKTANTDCMIGTLSGGNIQRTIIARELSADPKLLFACEITMGLDVESCRYVYDMLLNMRREQKAVLLLSSNINEVMSLADRILVIHEGEIVAHFPRSEDFNKEELGEYMLGLKVQDRQLKEVS